MDLCPYERLFVWKSGGGGAKNLGGYCFLFLSSIHAPWKVLQTFVNILNRHNTIDRITLTSVRYKLTFLLSSKVFDVKGLTSKWRGGILIKIVMSLSYVIELSLGHYVSSIKCWFQAKASAKLKSLFWTNSKLRTTTAPIMHPVRSYTSWTFSNFQG